MNLFTQINATMAVDKGLYSKEMTELKSVIWVDPNGCQHWIVDDGIEGYISRRLKPDGRPDCKDDYPVNAVVGKQNNADVFRGDLIQSNPSHAKKGILFNMYLLYGRGEA